jgi:hypothetical protein
VRRGNEKREIKGEKENDKTERRGKRVEKKE